VDRPERNQESGKTKSIYLVGSSVVEKHGACKIIANCELGIWDLERAQGGLRIADLAKAQGVKHKAAEDIIFSLRPAP
jgi:hypothetical protein